jgi:hypothetical protein
MKNETKKSIVETWEKTGFLKGISGTHHKEQIALLLDNQQLFNQKSPNNSDIDVLFKTVSIPIVRRVFGRFIGERIVSLQSMIGTVALIGCRDAAGNLQKSEVAGRNRVLETKFPIKFGSPDENYIDYPGEDDFVILKEYESLVEEYADEDPILVQAQVVAKLSSKIEEEISREIITDLLKTAASRTTHIWQSPEHLKDSIRIASNRDIYRASGNAANWIVTNPTLAEALSADEDFDDSDVQQSVDNGIYYRGSLGAIRVYADSMFGDFILLGFKGDPFQSGYIFSPYIPITLAGEDSILMYYAKKLIANSYYAVINVEGYSYEEEIEEVDRESVELSEDQMEQWSQMADAMEEKFPEEQEEEKEL